MNDRQMHTAALEGYMRGLRKRMGEAETADMPDGANAAEGMSGVIPDHDDGAIVITIGGKKVKKRDDE